MLRIVLPLVLVAGILVQISYADSSEGVLGESFKYNKIDNEEKTTPCLENEKFEVCPSALCEPQTCEEAGNYLTNTSCTYQLPGQDCPVEPGCICQEGFLRDSKGVCIPSIECPICGDDKNATSGCEKNCGRTCSSYNRSNSADCDIPFCGSNDCKCRSDYVKDERTGKCVLPKDCTPPCPLNEYYSMCKNSAFTKKTCKDLSKEIDYDHHDPSQECQQGCVCLDGYLRAKNGTCVPTLQCDVPLPKCKPNEELTPCGRSGCVKIYCTDLFQGIICRDTFTCLPSCQCVEGFLRASFDNHTCVPIDECPMPKCSDNEEYSQCSNGLCDYQDCKDKGKTKYCPPMAPGSCVGGCICSDNFLRNNNGVCVHQEECEDNTVSLPKCTPNEVLTPCGQDGCMKSFCSDVHQGPVCRDRGTCRPICDCKEGFLRASYENDTCVPINECPKTYEEYREETSAAAASAEASSRSSTRSDDTSTTSTSSSSSSAESSASNSVNAYSKARCKKNERWVECPDILCVPFTCKQLGQPISCPRIIPGRCPSKPACVCIDGYVKDKNGVCIPKKSCPKCEENERFVECPDAFCIPSSCVQLGRSLLCPIAIPGHCPRKAGCICVEEYVRDNNATCIPKKDCPSCRGDPNAQAGCGFLCGKRCDDEAVPKPCPCEINGCQCKKGFTYDRNQGKCVCPKKCTKPCPKNEVYTSCANGGCGRWNCTQIDQPELCIDPIKCFGGCKCRNGYLRARNGECIPQNQCNKSLCPKSNEVWDSCRLGCPPSKCGINDAAVSCQANLPCLPPGCRCQDGYYKTNDGDCVLFEDCPADTSIQGPASTCSDQVEKLFIQGSAAWNGKMLLESYKLTPSTSLIMSPFSLFVPMGELLAFSQGRTKEQFLKVFNLSSKDDLRCIFPSLINKIKAVQNVILTLANRLFIADMYPVDQNFLDTTREMFDAVAESLDFNDGAAAARRINEWAADSTNNRIKQIASPDNFSQDTRLVLANAIYFLGNWTHQFNKDSTNDRDFYVNKDTIVKIPTMFQQNTFKYGYSEKLNSQVLSLPYKGNEIEFVIVLPNEIEGLSAVIDAAQDPAVFNEAYDNMSFKTARVHLPKIKTESESNLSYLMQKSGITDVFNPAASNLTGILETYEPLYISSAIQKAFCLVNEEGTEAAAVNVITVGTTSAQIPPPKIIDFDCNRPFAFYIMFSKIQLFSGTFVKQNEDGTE